MQIKEIKDKSIWENFVKTTDGNFLQSYNWGGFHQSLGKKVFYLGLFENDQQIGSFLTIKEIAKRGNYLAVFGGPNVLWKKEYLQIIFEFLKKLAQQESCVFVRFRANVINNQENLQTLIDLSNLKIKKASMYLTCELTNQLDLTQSLDDLLKGMRKNTRRIIKRQEKYEVDIVKTINEKSLEEFYQIHIELAKRQKFVPFKFKFLQDEFKAFAKDNQVMLIESRHKGDLLASAFVVFYNKEASYHYGVSGPLNHEYQGSYFCQWEAIKEAKKRGLEIYNFWGVAPKDQKSHRFYNLSIFKRGFGGEEIDYLPTHDLIVKPFFYLFNLLVETIRKKVRSL
jgi:lipid II:glycine glycyltransferase (peptidoglycan interpeptide bridge formation enzyme)